VAALVVVLVAPSALVWRLQGGPLPAVVSLTTPALPQRMAPAPNGPLFTPAFEGARVEAQQHFRLGDSTASMHVAYYVRQTYGHKLVSSQNVLVRSKDEVWRVSSAGMGALDVAGQAIPVLRAEVRRGQVGQALPGDGTLQVRQVVWVGGRWVASGAKASLLAVWHQLTGRGDDAVALTFTLPEGGSAPAGPALDQFVAQHLGEIGVWLAAARPASSVR
jgi:EpsI family protein